jgi:hypothetical protein
MKTSINTNTFETTNITCRNIGGVVMANRWFGIDVATIKNFEDTEY